jgi:hypothetical protein
MVGILDEEMNSAWVEKKLRERCIYLNELQLVKRCAAARRIIQVTPYN